MYNEHSSQSLAIKGEEGNSVLPTGDVPHTDGEVPHSSTSVGESKPVVVQSSATLPEDVRSRHPNEFKKGTRKHREALKDFFELSVESPPIGVSDPYRENLGPPGSDRSQNYRQIEENDTTLASILEHYVEPHLAAMDQTEPVPITIAELYKTHNNVCKAIAEIELSASTLRTNSRALLVARKIVTRCAFDIFKLLDDFRPPTRPDFCLPAGVAPRFDEWAATKEKDWKFNEKCAQRKRKILISEYSALRRRERERQWENVRNENSKSLCGVGVSALHSGLGEVNESELKRVWDEARSTASKAMENTLQSYIYLEGFHLDYSLFDPIFLALRLDWGRAWARKLGTPFEGMPAITKLWRNKRSYGYYDEFPLLSRVTDELNWIREDTTAHPNNWTRDEQQRASLWRSSVLGWTERGEQRMQAILNFAEMSVTLLHELRRIDGGASLQYLNVLRPEEDIWYTVEEYALKMQVEMKLGDENQFRCHCNDLFLLIEKHLTSSALRQGLSTLIRKQDHFRNTFMDFATVAIFFSSITATTLQFSFEAANTSLSSTIVNLCWFSSLVLSIASATNSFLGAIVHQSPEYLRPSTKLDFRFLQAWFKFVPPTLLSISGTLFIIGISFFTLLSTSTSNDQGRAVKNTTVALVSSNIFAVLVMILLAFTPAAIPTILHFVSIPIRIAIFLPVTFIVYLLHWLDILYLRIKIRRARGSLEALRVIQEETFSEYSLRRRGSWFEAPQLSDSFFWDRSGSWFATAGRGTIALFHPIIFWRFSDLKDVYERIQVYLRN